MSNKITPKTLSGFVELLPEEQLEFNFLINTVENTYKKFGFLPMDTPILEYADVILAKMEGEINKQVYSFSKSNTNFALRFDLTVPLAKYVALYSNKLTFPFKRYQIGKVFRGERPQKGRFREFYQFDVDIISKKSIDLSYDAEIIEVINCVFNQLNLPNFVIKINNRKIIEGIIKHFRMDEKMFQIMQVLDKVNKIGVVETKQLLANIILPNDLIKTLMLLISYRKSNKEVIEYLNSLNINNNTFFDGVYEITELLVKLEKIKILEKNYQIDFSITRGLDYYTGTIFETFIQGDENFGSICSGGRYDNLCGLYCEESFSGVGLSIGITRLYFYLKNKGLNKGLTKNEKNIIIMPLCESVTAQCYTIARTLRQKDVSAQIFFDSTMLKSLFKYANKLKISYVIVVGENEIVQNRYVLKEVSTGNEFTDLTIEDIITKLKQ